MRIGVRLGSLGQRDDFGECGVVGFAQREGSRPRYIAAHINHAATANQDGFSGLDLQFGIVIFAQRWVP